MVTLHVGMAKIVCQCFSSIWSIDRKVLAKTIRKFEKHALTFKNLFLVAFISQTKVLQEIFWHTIEGETLTLWGPIPNISGILGRFYHFYWNHDFYYFLFICTRPQRVKLSRKVFTNPCARKLCSQKWAHLIKQKKILQKSLKKIIIILLKTFKPGTH